MMFTCKQIQKFMYDYVENNLGTFLKWRFDWHIRKCKECLSYVDLYKSTANPREFFKENPPPPEFKESMITFLEKEGILNKNPEGEGLQST